MKVRQICLPHAPQVAELAALAAIRPQLLLVFGAPALCQSPGLRETLSAAMPLAAVFGCSTAGEIGDTGVSEHSLVLTALHFAQPQFKVVSTELASMLDSAAAGARLASQLPSAELHTVLVLGQGVDINGSALIAGLQGGLPPGVAISGGLAGDGGAFRQTCTLSAQAVSARQVLALGFYGPHIQLRHGCFHGWQPFGPARKVTRAEGNLLYELDGEPALQVYKRYLGEYAKDLPASGLLFPFEMLSEDLSAVGLIRTILAVDAGAGSLVLAGDIELGGYLRLMHASTDSLVDGAQVAAERSLDATALGGESLALLVSCVGRKLVMGARVDEEVEAVAEVFGEHAHVAGFYSYGEISPLLSATDCKLHNQTMTITHLSER